MNESSAAAAKTCHGGLSRTLPFGVFMLFVGVEELLRLALRWGWLSFPDQPLSYLYLFKTICVAAILIRYLPDYRELRWRDLAGDRGATLISLLTGLFAFLVWISLDWSFNLAGAGSGFDPTLFPAGALRLYMTAVRVAGAVLVVPVMEELFWRSFLLRYLISPDFESVPLGAFTWGSFLAASLLFGLEHHEVMAGVVAGALYSLILYRTRSLAHCVLAHAVTNLALACYVLRTGNWYFW